MIKKLIALTVLSTISASPLQASEDFDGKTYFYGGIGKADVDFDNDAVESIIGEDTLFTLGIGHELNKFLSVEAETNHVFDNAVEPETHFWNATLGLKADYDFNQNIAAFVKGGIAFNNMDTETCDDYGCVPTDSSSKNFTYSVGLELTNDYDDLFARIQYTHHIKEEAEYYFGMSDYSVNSLSLMIGHKF